MESNIKGWLQDEKILVRWEFTILKYGRSRVISGVQIADTIEDALMESIKDFAGRMDYGAEYVRDLWKNPAFQAWTEYFRPELVYDQLLMFTDREQIFLENYQELLNVLADDFAKLNGAAPYLKRVEPKPREPDIVEQLEARGLAFYRVTVEGWFGRTWERLIPALSSKNASDIAMESTPPVPRKQVIRLVKIISVDQLIGDVKDIANHKYKQGPQHSISS